MGITGLLQGLKPFTEKRNVLEFANQSLAIDTSSWLHKSVYSIADHYVEAMEDKGRHCHDAKCIDTSSRYIVKRCEELLLYARIKALFLVLDGKRCPLKAVTNQDREQKRQKALSEARAHRRSGARDKMFEKYKTCIKITHPFTVAVMEKVMQHFRKNRVVHEVQSPYEADAQLVQLCISGITQAIITEDSDVLVYSAACRTVFPVLFKLDRNSGSCQVITMSWLLDPEHNQSLLEDYKTSSKTVTALELTAIRWMQQELKNPGLGSRLFVQACVLAGCDYAPSLLTGVGLINAFKLIDRSCSAKNRFRVALKHHYTSRRGGLVDSQEYEATMAKAEIVFFHHPVWNQDKRSVEYLLPFAGKDDKHMPCVEAWKEDLPQILGTLQMDIAAAAPAPTHQPKGSLYSFMKVKKEVKLIKSSAQSTLKPPPVAEIQILDKSQRPDRKRKAQSIPKAQQAIFKHNPYSKKTKAQAASKKAKSPLVPSKARTQDSNNPFEKHRFKSNGKENNSLQFLSALQSKGDIRFVKPAFAKDGKRIQQVPIKSTQQLENQNTAFQGLKESESEMKSRPEPSPVSESPEPIEEPMAELLCDPSQHNDSFAPSNHKKRPFLGLPAESPNDSISECRESPEANHNALATFGGENPEQHPTEDFEYDNISWQTKRSRANQESTLPHSTSKYFAGASHSPLEPIRRVTLETSSSQDSPENIHETKPVYHVDLPRAPVVDLYDDFLSPKKLSPTRHSTFQEELEEDTPEHRSLFPMLSKQKVQRPKNSIGPARTMRGPLKSRHNPIAKGFERQVRRANFEKSDHVALRYTNRREPTPPFARRAKKSPGKTHRSQSNTLLNHFNFNS